MISNLRFKFVASRCILMLLVSACGEDDNFTQRQCDCSTSYSLGVSSPQPARTMSVSGKVRLAPIPRDLEKAQFYALVDELEPASPKSPQRIVEKKLAWGDPKSAGQEDAPEKDRPLGRCGVGGPEPQKDDGGNSHSSAEASQCVCSDASLALSQTADPKPKGAGSVLKVQDDVRFQFDFAVPDERSAYRIVFFVDFDGDGEPGSGDYLSEKFVPFATQGAKSEGLYLTAQRQQSNDSTLLSGSLTFEGSAATGLEAGELTVEIFQITSIGRKKIRESSVETSREEGWSFDIPGQNPDTKARYQVEARFTATQPDASVLTAEENPVDVLTFGNPRNLNLTMTSGSKP